jgi:hypothetical protein
MNKMENLILKIKSYQQDVTYLTLNVSANLSNEQLKNIALDCKKIVDELHKTWDGSPNIMRFQNKEGIYDYEMKQLVAYY